MRNSHGSTTISIVSTISAVVRVTRGRHRLLHSPFTKLLVQVLPQFQKEALRSFPSLFPLLPSTQDVPKHKNKKQEKYNHNNVASGSNLFLLVNEKGAAIVKGFSSARTQQTKRRLKKFQVHFAFLMATSAIHEHSRAHR